MIEEWFHSHQETSDGLTVPGSHPVHRLGIQRPPVVGEPQRLDRGLAQVHRRLFAPGVDPASVVLADPVRGDNPPVRRCALPQKMASAYFGAIAILAIRPWKPPFYEELSGCGGIHGPSMKSELHENRHETLHGWRKIKESFRRSDTDLGAARWTKGAFWLVKGFMILTVKG
jgi:hypothetical protein